MLKKRASAEEMGSPPKDVACEPVLKWSRGNSRYRNGEGIGLNKIPSCAFMTKLVIWQRKFTCNVMLRI
jgi:hypothetical protein